MLLRHPVASVLREGEEAYARGGNVGVGLVVGRLGGRRLEWRRPCGLHTAEMIERMMSKTPVRKFNKDTNGKRRTPRAV